MKKIFVILIAAVMAITVSSCVEQSGKYQSMIQERDSLRTQIQTISAQYDSTLQTLNDIETGFQEIRESEGRMMVNMESVEGNQTASVSKKLVSEVKNIKDILAENKAKISKLQSSLNKSGKKNKTLMATIARYEKEIEDKNAVIVAMQDELAKKNITIDGLNETVAELNTTLSQKNVENAEQQKMIEDQISENNKVFYCIGTKKELAEANITSGTGIVKSREVLKKDFDKSLFRVQDKRSFDKVSFDAKKAVILTSHPQGSYTVETDEAGTTTLTITDADSFWSTSKYLVIRK